MNLRNASQYDSRALRTVILATHHAVMREKTNSSPGWWDDLLIDIQTGRKNCAWEWDVASLADGSKKHRRLILVLPKLTGTEFIPLLRQQHGGRSTANVQHEALRAESVALLIQKAIGVHYGWKRPKGQANMLKIGVRAAFVRKHIPEFVPVRILREVEPEERDIVAERYERLLELEKVWASKAKRAQTRLRTLRTKRKAYERRMQQRSRLTKEG